MSYQNLILPVSTLLILISVFRFTDGNCHTRSIPDSVVQNHSPVISYASHDSLLVTRGKKVFSLASGDTLRHGDELQTCSGQFVIITYPAAGSMIIHPLSTIRLDLHNHSVQLRDAIIHVELHHNHSGTLSSFNCFDASIRTDRQHAEASSFGIQCHRESGISVTSQQGTLHLKSNNQHYILNSGKALAGRATSDAYTKVPIPKQPGKITQGTYSRHTVYNDQTGLRFDWNPVDFTDKYLVHIYQVSNTRTVHRFGFYKSNAFSMTNSLPPGMYAIRILAIDYYGVTGKWSVPLSFQYQP